MSDFKHEDTGKKKKISITIDLEVYLEAKKKNINISRAAQEGVHLASKGKLKEKAG